MKKIRFVKEVILTGMSVLLLTGLCAAKGDPSLVGYWKFDEGKGNIVEDSSGNGNDGNVYGTVWSDGKSGHCLSFNGMDAYVKVPGSESMNLTSDLTIEAWVKVNSVEKTGYIVSNATKYFLRFDYKKLHFGLCASADKKWKYVMAKSTFPKFGEWVHVAATYSKEKGIAKLYENGIEVEIGAKDMGSYEISKENSPFYIGAHNSEILFFDGLIDEAKVYNRTLTNTEIKNHYEGNEEYDIIYLKDVLFPQYEKRSEKIKSLLNAFQTRFKNLELSMAEMRKVVSSPASIPDKTIILSCQKIEETLKEYELMEQSLKYMELLGGEETL